VDTKRHLTDSAHQHASKTIRAVEYVRVSTERPDSTDTQRKVIGQYAKRRGIIIVRTYTDAGKSGPTPCRPSMR
jgi:DNA invertase Pin-like site-specific DNA recombinase